jgi:hypothetical protein
MRIKIIISMLMLITINAFGYDFIKHGKMQKIKLKRSMIHMEQRRVTAEILDIIAQNNRLEY